MSADSYAQDMADTPPPLPWWGAWPRDWREYIASVLISALTAVCVLTFGPHGPLGIGAAISCGALANSAFVWWQRRRTPRSRRQRVTEAAAVRS